MQASELKNVLVVDDTQGVRQTIRKGLANFKDQLTVLTCENGRKAIETLESQSIDLVVTDIKMPEVDGLELLAYMATHFPALPAIVISGFATQENTQKLDELGVYSFIRKPLSIKELRKHIFEVLREDSHNGSLSGISIAGFVQLIESEQKTCLLEIESAENLKGYFYFKQGVLFDALFDQKRGEAAALEMINWERARLSFRNLPPRAIEQRIQTPIMQLILESTRLKDERASNEDRQGDNPTEHEQAESAIKQAHETDVWADQTREKPIINNQIETKGGDSQQTELHERQDNELSLTYKQTFDYAEGRNFMPGLKETLRNMADEMDGVLAVGIAGMDGITVASHNPSGADMDAIAAKFAMLMKLGQRATMDIKGMGEFEENLIQSQNAWILTRFLNKNYYLAVAVSREGTLGNVRLVAQKYAERFRKTL